MSSEYRPLWWRPWLDLPALPATDAEAPDVTGFQMPEAPEPSEAATGAEPTTPSE